MFSWLKRKFQNLGQSIQAYIVKLGEENEKTFGKGPLDCCDLNKDPKHKKE